VGMPGTIGRRRFLKTLAAGGVGVAAHALGWAAWKRVAAASGLACTGVWGDLPGPVGSGANPWTCGNPDGYKILELNFLGGASQWETLWLPGNATKPGFTAHGLSALPLSDLIWTGYQGGPGYNCTQDSAIPSSYLTDYAYFADDENQTRIYWGAPAKPLWYNRPDIFNRCLMMTAANRLPPHEAAIPYCLTGLLLGNSRMAGTGAAVERRARAVDPLRVLPASYVFHTGAPLAEAAAAATGEHPGSCRPLVIRVDPSPAFTNSLGRSNITKPEADDLALALRHEYRDRLVFGGAQVRSAGFDGYWAAAELLNNAPLLQTLFSGLLVVNPADPSIKICPTFPSTSTYTFLAPGFNAGSKTMLTAAAKLLSATGPARYVCILDDGLTGSYDTHSQAGFGQLHLQRTSANYYDVLKNLADVIGPNGINLDDTMVIITTEFGRTSYVNANFGRDHHTDGYVLTVIGGPIPLGTTANPNRRIAGAIDQTTGAAVWPYMYSATDLRGAVLLAAGIDPFAPNNFRDADFSLSLTDGLPVSGQANQNTEAQIRTRLKEWILGV
jgi:uncharacterized protein DUF1501